MNGGVARAWPYIRKNGARIALNALVNIVLPALIYHYAKRGLGDVRALIASSAPPIAWSLTELALKRRIDAVSVLALTGIGLSLLAFVGGGDARFLQLRENLVNVLIGALFLGSAAIGKPLIYQLSRAALMRRSSSELSEFESLRDNPHFRRAMTVMTLVWGVGLIVAAALSSLLVFTLSIQNYLIASPILGYGAMGTLGLWSFWYVRRQKRKGAARRARQSALAQDASTPS